MKIQNTQIYSNATHFEQQNLNQILQKLRTLERKVIAHEMAHKSVAGKYATAVHYGYTKGPDGKLYITSGEVYLDISEEATAEETAKKMEIIKRAALAPTDPSPQDFRVAHLAVIKEMKARLYMQKEERISTFEIIV